ncbi:MAG: hypothetical protein RIC85_02995 [Gammaproteobacteria bacterium]
MAKKTTRDGLPFYEGAAKDQKLRELEDTAISHHLGAINTWRNTLDHARQAGEALNEAKRILGRRGRWTKWLTKHFCEAALASKETARVYMRIAREWDRVKDAWAEGITANSIAAVLRVLKNQKEAKPTQKEWETHEATKDLRKQFADKLKTLDHQELTILAEMFEYCSWPAMHKDLRDTVCKVLEFDYYYEYRDNYEQRRKKRDDKHEVRSKIKHALNKKRTTRRKVTDALNQPNATRASRHAR